MTETMMIRGHHLYQLYKAYQLRRRTVLKKIWEYVAKNLLAPYCISYFDVQREVFGTNPKQQTIIKKTLDTILKNENTKIKVIASNSSDILCAVCPENQSCLSIGTGKENYRDRFVIELLGLKINKEYSLKEIIEVLSKDKKWIRAYEVVNAAACRVPFDAFKSALIELNNEQIKDKSFYKK